MNKLYIIGTGPGNLEGMTIGAYKALSKCETIVGYTVYVDLIKELFPGKKYISTQMKKEEERCLTALKSAEDGHITAIISSGDACVYGMASLVFELSEGFDVEIEVISGVTAANSGGAVLGSPFSQDFCTVSLSDLMIPWEKIENHLKYAGKADFCIAVYNPSSKKRVDYLKKACRILLKYKSPDTVCGIVRNIGRDGECYEITDLKTLADVQTDMFTTVFIGNAETKIINGKMVTPRGYKIKSSSVNMEVK